MTYPLAEPTAPAVPPLLPTTPAVASVIARLRRTAAITLHGRPNTFNEATRFYEDLGFDSLDEIEFFLAVEEAFAVTLPDDVAEQALTVGQLAQLLMRLQPLLASLDILAGSPPPHKPEVIALARILGLARAQYQQEFSLAQALGLPLPQTPQERLLPLFFGHAKTVSAVGLELSSEVLEDLLALTVPNS